MQFMLISLCSELQCFWIWWQTYIKQGHKKWPANPSKQRASDNGSVYLALSINSVHIRGKCVVCLFSEACKLKKTFLLSLLFCILWVFCLCIFFYIAVLLLVCIVFCFHLILLCFLFGCFSFLSFFNAVWILAFVLLFICFILCPVLTKQAYFCFVEVYFHFIYLYIYWFLHTLRPSAAANLFETKC